MSEKTPNFLPYEEYRALEGQIKDVAEVAREADHLNSDDRFHSKHNGWVDSTRMLGQSFASHRIKHREGRFGGQYKDGRIDVNIQDGERTVHSYSDHRLNGSATEMKVRRNGAEKRLRSENPLVFKMLTEIALKDIEQKAREDIDKHQEKKAA